MTAATGAVALGSIGASVSWYFDRLPRLAVASALTGMIAGGLGGALLRTDRPHDDSESAVHRAAGGAVIGGGVGAALVGGLAGVIMPSVSAITRMAGMREFGVYGAVAGSLIGAVVGATSSPRVD